MPTIIHAEALDDASFEAFGRVLRVPTVGAVEPTIARENVTLYGDLARIAAVDHDVEFGLAILQAREPTLNEMEQHRLTAELLFAVKGDFVLPVAPPDDAEPAAARVRAFFVPEGHGCVLHTATWHWAPYPVAERCEILVGFRAWTPRDDMVIVPLASGERIEVAWSR